jgi:anti-sigma-K factor RskA
MTPASDHHAARPEDETLAGEYVLGVLSFDSRRRIEARMASEPAFARLVTRWQSDLETFNEEYQEVSPGAGVFVKIEERLFGVSQGNSARIWNSALFWRWISAATTTAALVALVYAAGIGQGPEGAVPLVAELSAPTNAVNMLASYDAESGRIRIVPIAAGKAEEKSLELWLVPETGNTISLGVFPPGTTGELVIPADMRARIGEGTTFAVSLEPFGGSPTGQATGPVVAVGVARKP